ncbi:MAG: T9SS type A sorting domain-containing protein [Bacteroidetes bacterium]|nr:T9SS type A sorting domain-containing protein [Bacteroidota bacterium]MBL7103480.1 T9SS type A sorting domain-containing protein [Bacteroidales bacterium]
MKTIKNVFLFYLLIVPIVLNAQSIYFNERYQSNSGIWSGAISIIETNEGYLIGGTTGTPPNNSWHQITLTILNEYGEKIDEKLLGNTISEYYIAGNSLIRSNDELIPFAGTRRTFPGKFAHDEILLMKLNNEYDTLWSKFYGEKELPYDSSYIARQLIEASDSNLIIVGTMTPELDYIYQILLIKIDSTGNFLWERFYTYPNTNYVLKGYSVTETPDKGFAIGAYRFKPGFNYTGEPMVYKVDSLGNEEWFINVGGPYYDTKTLLCNAHDGNIIAAACYADSMSGSWDAYRTIKIKKIDLEGNIIWDKKFGTSEYNKRVSNIRQTNDGGYIATGYTTTAQLVWPYPDFSGWMLKINSEGDSLWYRLYYNLSGTNGYNYLYDVITTSDNGFAACGQVFGPSTNYTQHAWVIKVDSMGCDTPGCATGTNTYEFVEETNGELKVWPNPVKEKFQVSGYGFQVGGQMVIKVYNSQGLKVEEIKVPDGKETITVNVKGWQKGMYFVQLIVNGIETGSAKFIKS